MPEVGKGLGNIHRLLNRVGTDRLDPHDRPQNRKVLLRLKTFESGSKEKQRFCRNPHHRFVTYLFIQLP